jgi:hypothetical protein
VFNVLEEDQGLRLLLQQILIDVLLVVAGLGGVFGELEGAAQCH